MSCSLLWIARSAQSKALAGKVRYRNLDLAYHLPAHVSSDITDCGDKTPSNVISISYHFEPDYLDSSITPIVQRECTEFGKVSQRLERHVRRNTDVSIIISSVSRESPLSHLLAMVVLLIRKLKVA